MDNSSQNKGPYKHYERPNESRVKTYKKTTRWGVVVLVLVVIIIAMIPVVHTIASKNANHEQTKVSTTISKTNKNSIVQNKKKSISKPVVKSSMPSQKPANKQKDVKPNPNNTSKATTYTVKAGDSLSTIAAKNNMTVEQLMQLNGISDPKNLAAGQVIKLK